MPTLMAAAPEDAVPIVVTAAPKAAMMAAAPKAAVPTLMAAAPKAAAPIVVAAAPKTAMMAAAPKAAMSNVGGSGADTDDSSGEGCRAEGSYTNTDGCGAEGCSAYTDGVETPFWIAMAVAAANTVQWRASAGMLLVGGTSLDSDRLLVLPLAEAAAINRRVMLRRRAQWCLGGW